METRFIALTLCTALGLSAGSHAFGQPRAAAKGATVVSASAHERPITQPIVKFKDETVGTFSATAGRSKIARLAAHSDVGLAYARPMSGLSHVIRLATPLPRAEAFALAKRLEMDPSVQYVEVDDWAQAAFIPNDPGYLSHHWHYHAPSAARGNAGGINAPAAWDLARGQGVVVAVVDSGVAAHPDLAPNVLPG